MKPKTPASPTSSHASQSVAPRDQLSHPDNQSSKESNTAVLVNTDLVEPGLWYYIVEAENRSLRNAAAQQPSEAPFRVK